MTKLLLTPLLLVALTGCSSSESAPAPANGGSSPAQPMSLDGPIDPASPEAPFGSFYGNYKIIGCENRSRAAKETNYCGYEALAVFADRRDATQTILSLRKRIESNGISYNESSHFKTTSAGRQYREETGVFASQTWTLNSSNQREYRETTFKKISDRRVSLVLKRSTWIDAGQWKDDREEDFELALEKK